MAEKKGQEEKGAEKKSKLSKKMLIIVGVLVLLLAGIGAGTFFFFLNESEEDAVAEMVTEENGEFSTEGGSTIGPMVEVEDFIINIIDEQDARYLKAALTLELDRPESVPEVEQRMPQIRDAILLLIGNKTFNEVRDLQGKLQLRAELIARINSLLSRAKVTKVYFTDFVVQ